MERCLLVGRLVVGCLLVGRFLVGGVVVRGFLVRSVVVGGVVVGSFLERLRLVGDQLEMTAAVVSPRRVTTHRVWLLTGGIALLAAALAVPVAAMPPLDPPVRIPWWVLVPAVYLAELGVIHFKFREDAHSFSMSEIPLVLGLFFADPLGLLAAQLIGNAAALGLTRRQPAVKLGFNLAQFSLQAIVALLVFRGLLGSSDPLGAAGWAASLAAVTVALAVATALIATAIHLAGGRMSREDALDVLMLSGLAGTANTALALVAVTVLWLRPTMAWAALVPPVVLFLAYQAYAAQRQERQRLQALYDTTKVLHGSPQIEAALLAGAGHTQTMFEADRVEILVFPDGPQQEGYRTAVGPGERRETMLRVLTPSGDEVWMESLRHGRSLLLDPDPGSARARRGPATMVAPLHARGRVLGVMVVDRPLGDVSSFSTDDLRLLETVASQISVSLENGRLEDSLMQLTRLKEELRHQALHDPLTGLANRALLREQLAEVSQRVAQEGATAAVMFLDLDDFKAVNDRLGHSVGDQLLVEVAKRLQACSRGHDTVARLGGDEFAVLLSQLPHKEDATLVAERIARELRRPFLVAGKQLTTHASVGIAFVRPGLLPDEVIRAADHAMYAAKQQRKGSYRIFDDGVHSELVRRVELRADLEQAIAAGELRVHYQPIVHLEDGEVWGIEALVRWEHPDLGLISPDEFIPLAEDTGLIVPLGRWVLREACSAAAAWGPAGRAPAISVNLSPRQLSDVTIVHDVAAALAESGLDPHRLILEVTESVLMQASVPVLDQLKALGVRIAIDDFGTGYSSLGYLDTLPVDIIKVDKAFIDRLGQPDASPILKMVLQIGRTLGLDTIAEGIERPEQVARLLHLGCELGQGFHFTRPVEREEIEPLLTRRPALSLVEG